MFQKNDTPSTRHLCPYVVGNILREPKGEISARIVLTLIVIILATAASSCVGKLHTFSFDSEKYRRYNSSWDLMEVEFSTPRIANGHFDLAFQGSDRIMEIIGEVPVVLTSGTGSIQYATIPAFSRSLKYFSIGPRLYPFGWPTRLGLVPYIGGGVGYYIYGYETNGPGGPVANPPGVPPTYECFDVNNKSKIIASGMGKFATVGLILSTGPAHERPFFRWLLVAELRLDFAKLDPARDIDMSGHAFHIGIGFVWN